MKHEYDWELVNMFTLFSMAFGLLTIIYMVIESGAGAAIITGIFTIAFAVFAKDAYNHIQFLMKLDAEIDRLMNKE